MCCEDMIDVDANEECELTEPDVQPTRGVLKSMQQQHLQDEDANGIRADGVQEVRDEGVDGRRAGELDEGRGGSERRGHPGCEEG